jgi:hypothetical protein
MMTIIDGQLALQTCQGVTKSGKPCSFRAKYDGFCGVHKSKGDCSICYEKITSRTSSTTRCKHEFHRACLERWLEENNTCPLCRTHAPLHTTTGQLRPRPATLSQFLQDHWSAGHSVFMVGLSPTSAPVVVSMNPEGYLEMD